MTDITKANLSLREKKLLSQILNNTESVQGPWIEADNIDYVLLGKVELVDIVNGIKVKLSAEGINMADDIIEKLLD